MACDAMGTRFELVLVGDDCPRLRSAGEAAIAEIMLWHQRLSFFDQGSFVSHVNREAYGAPIGCDAEFFSLLLLCRDVWRDSENAFDPTLAALLRASGFRDRPRQTRSIAVAREASGFDKVELDERRRTVRFSVPGLGIDLGAVGKGWALDRAREVLLELNVTNALIHGGTSSIVAIGSSPEEVGWLVALGQEPNAPVVRLHENALGVSAPHGRTVSEGSETHGHILDPRTGLSVRRTNLAAVVADSAALADAWSTALLVHGVRPSGMPGAFTSFLEVASADPSARRWRNYDPQAHILHTPSRG